MKDVRNETGILGMAVTGMLVAAGQARADVVLAGPDTNDGSYSTAQLSAAAATEGDTVVTSALTGISLWGFLGGVNTAGPVYGAITTSTPADDNTLNPILRYYLVETNSTGQQSVVSLGEIDTNFSPKSATPVFVAYQNTGGSLLTAPELVVPGQPGRNLTNVTSLQILSVPALLNNAAGGASTSVALSGNVTAPASYTQTMLQNNFAPVVETVNSDTYTSVGLWAFLNPTTSGSTNQIVITQATDGYEVVEALAELDPTLGAVTCVPGNLCDILPYADTGTNFSSSNPNNDDIARTIFPADNAHGRWESNLSAVIVEEAPEPGSLTLLAVALVAIGITRRRLISPLSLTVHSHGRGPALDRHDRLGIASAAVSRPTNQEEPAWIPSHWIRDFGSRPGFWAVMPRC
jgi:hypothetical protein